MQKSIEYPNICRKIQPFYPGLYSQRADRRRSPRAARGLRLPLQGISELLWKSGAWSFEQADAGCCENENGWESAKDGRGCIKKLTAPNMGQTR